MPLFSSCEIAIFTRLFNKHLMLEVFNHFKKVSPMAWDSLHTNKK